MRHLSKRKTLNMPGDQRVAVLRNLMISLLKTGKVSTTLAKAKVVAPCIEHIITRAKVNNLSNTRYLVSKLNKDVVKNAYEIATKFADRKGGYTRIIKTWQRYGDAGKTAIIEFVD